MKFLSVVLGLTYLTDYCHGAPLNNPNPTIWAHDTVVVMKSEINRLYTYNYGLYNQRHIFDAGSHDCISPPPDGHFWLYNTCPNGNKLVSEAILAIAGTWKALARAMFPVYYNVTDTALQARATLSDFSHFYNHLLLEIQSLQNTTAFFICKANIRRYSDLWNSTNVANTYNADYTNVRFGPPVGWIGDIPLGANNGTDGAYPYDSTFTKSIRRNGQREIDSWTELRIEMSYPEAEFPTNLCKSVTETNGTGYLPPRPPGTFP